MANNPGGFKAYNVAHTADAIVSRWPYESQALVQEMIRQYGLPQEATQSMVLWYDNGPWRQTIVYREGVPHNFPRPHRDLIKQTVSYRVPPEKCAELTQFDGSVTVDRTKGQLSAHCDSEAMNILALNLAHEIIVGRRTVEEARNKYTEGATALMLRWAVSYAQELQFNSHIISAELRTADPDQSTTVMAGAVTAAREKMGQLFHRTRGR